MRKHAVIVVKGSGSMEPHVVHVLNTPDPGESGFYRQAVSLGAFFYSTKVRNQSPEALFVCELWHEFESRRRGMEDRLPDYTFFDVSNRIFNSIWEFYEFIGYDYKKKKYIRPMSVKDDAR